MSDSYPYVLGRVLNLGGIIAKEVFYRWVVVVVVGGLVVQWIATG